MWIQVFLSSFVGAFLFRCFYFLELECVIASWYPQALAVPSVAFEPRFRGSFRWHLLLPPVSLVKILITPCFLHLIQYSRSLVYTQGGVEKEQVMMAYKVWKFFLLDHRHSVQCNVWFGLVLFGVAPFLSLAQHQMRKKTISFSQFKTLGRIFSAKWKIGKVFWARILPWTGFLKRFFDFFLLKVKKVFLKAERVFWWS